MTEIPEGAVMLGDCVPVMASWPENSIDAIVADPPYGLEFMGKAFDTFRGASVDAAFGHWFAGFVDGEGCFSVHKKKVNGFETYDCQFSITLRADDKPILQRIQREIGMGTLHDRPARGGEAQARYGVSRKADCWRLVDLFRSFPLRAKKARDFEHWADAVRAWRRHEPNDWDDMAAARARLMSGRQYGAGVRIDPFQMWNGRWAREAFRVLKPGGHLLAFGGTRTFHRLAVAIEDAGFEIRDCLSWMYGSGFPKSLDVSKAIDKAVGAERPVLAFDAARARPNRTGKVMGDKPYDRSDNGATVTGAATPEAEQWQGWGTALKPAWEPIIMARKPLSERNVAANVLKHGTGAINVDACRIEMSAVDQAVLARGNGFLGAGYQRPRTEGTFMQGTPGAVSADGSRGRWPANVVLAHTAECREVGIRKIKGDGRQQTKGARPGGFMDVGAVAGDPVPAGPLYGDTEAPAWECAEECPVRLLDEQSGELPADTGAPQGPRRHQRVWVGQQEGGPGLYYGDTGGRVAVLLHSEG